MGYKATDPCIKRAFDDERLFVLMARDVTAPMVIAYWIKLNENIQPKEKLVEAEKCMMEMLERGGEFRARKLNILPQDKECDQCDGCGWHEGGTTIKTTCVHCGGTGRVAC